ncbi:MAG: Uma2 family endonuclease [Leptolyngbyaceae cyanobacterium RU_5_1]|nr:Uma2 family endonuclease [Leptolyngbyaceae cyanobacterium RU_5_1]
MILRHRTWEDYEDLLVRRKDNAGLRIQYSSATQEIKIMSPLPKHANVGDLLADLVKAILRYQGKDWQSFMPVTLKQMGIQGIEPDYCFYIQNRNRILGKERIGLSIDPPPDLAIEVDITSITYPEDYAAIAVPELWIYRSSELLIYGFDGQQYQDTQTSLQFPTLDVKTLLPQYCDRGWQLGSSVALRELEDFLNESGLRQ